jgi:hypothetical protein
VEAKGRFDEAAMAVGGEVAAAYRAMAAAAHETLTPEGGAAFEVAACLVGHQLLHVKDDVGRYRALLRL